MARAGVRGDIELEYELIGPEGGAPLVLVMGIGAQLVHWPDGLCAAIAARGFRVVRFDHRDVGLSTKLAHAGVPPVPALIARRLCGLPVTAPYTLADMAEDVVGLCDALGFDRAHVVGASMGGMIAQAMAIAHPRRVRTLTSMMAHSGELRFSFGHPRAMAALLGGPVQSREEAMARAESFYRAVGGRGFPFDVAYVRARAARSYDRCYYPAGFARHLAAVVASLPRTPALRTLAVPTLVLHGTDDRLVLPLAARALARSIPRATLRFIDGMGHDLPEGAWPAIADAVAAHARAAEH
jgi:pimeloyl-ACP methyl ester carboxylesterase